jgi:dsRNA-specific ribonuclease
MKREKTQINKIRHEKGKINTNTKKIQGIISDYFENLYLFKLENPEKMETFLVTYDHPKLNQGNLHHLNRSIVSNETEAEITK